MAETAVQRARRIRLLLLDVDGVLTDGKIYLGDGGAEMKAFDAKDGQGIKLAQKAHLEVGFLTARRSAVVERRAAELTVGLVVQEAADKGAALQDILATRQVNAEEVAYLGDDLSDLPVLRRVGLAGTVADAAPEVKAAARWRARNPGGRGAVREFIEFILRSQGRWAEFSREVL